MSTEQVLFDSVVKNGFETTMTKMLSTYDSEDSIDFRPENDYVLWHYIRKSLGNRSKNLILDVGGGTGRIAVPLID